MGFRVQGLWGFGFRTLTLGQSQARSADGPLHKNQDSGLVGFGLRVYGRAQGLGASGHVGFGCSMFRLGNFRCCCCRCSWRHFLVRKIQGGQAK